MVARVILPTHTCPMPRRSRRKKGPASTLAFSPMNHTLNFDPSLLHHEVFPMKREWPLAHVALREAIKMAAEKASKFISNSNGFEDYSRSTSSCQRSGKQQDNQASGPSPSSTIILPLHPLFYIAARIPSTK